jgi:hypothetical protein
MCFFAWRHVMAVESKWGVGRHGGGAGRPPMTGGTSLHLLEAWPTYHEWVWVLGDVCHVGCDTSVIHVMLHSSL